MSSGSPLSIGSGLPKAIGGGCLVSIIVLIALTGVFGSFYTIDEGDRGVLLTNGKVSGVSEPGFHFKKPIFQDIEKFSVRTEIDRFSTESYSRDIQAAKLVLSVNHRLNSGCVVEFYTTYGTDYASRILGPRVISAAKDVFGQYSAADAVAQRARLTAGIGDAITAAVDPECLTIEGVQVEDIVFSDAFEASIEQRMQAEIEVARITQNLAREKVEADIVRARAGGAADQTRAEAAARAEATRLQGDAEATAISARGRALRENPELIALIQAERWDGRLPTTMPPNGTVPFLSLAPARTE